MLLNYFVRAKFYAMQSAIYYQMIQYILIIILFLRPYGLNFWVELVLIFLIACMAVLIGWADRRGKVLESEQSIANTENKELREIRDLLIEAKNERRSSCTCNTIGDTGSDDHFTDNWG